MPSFSRMMMVQGIGLIATVIAGVVGGLLARSWIWAIACAVVAYALVSAGTMIWVGSKMRSDRDWSTFDDDF
ncbi:MAG TPA: hypothetical protein VFI65_20775 [Streptosporangiaceae bacterium]|nr:hypothetical protein [Streptosporangiaceae bacterium]